MYGHTLAVVFPEHVSLPEWLSRILRLLRNLKLPEWLHSSEWLPSIHREPHTSCCRTRGIEPPADACLMPHAAAHAAVHDSVRVADGAQNGAEIAAHVPPQRCSYGTSSAAALRRKQNMTSSALLYSCTLTRRAAQRLNQNDVP